MWKNIVRDFSSVAVMIMFGQEQSIGIYYQKHDNIPNLVESTLPADDQGKERWLLCYVYIPWCPGAPLNDMV